MNDKEKSAALTRLTGIGKYTGPPVSSFIKSWQGEMDVTTIDGTPFDYNAPNLYAPENMALAWQVLNWASDSRNPLSDTIDRWWVVNSPIELPPKEAQALWLDKILELAIGAGLVKSNEELIAKNDNTPTPLQGTITPK